MGVTGEVAQAGEVEPGAPRHLEHAAPCLVAQHLDLSGVEEPSVAGLILSGQVVVQAMHLLVQRQHLGVHDDLGQLRSAALAQGSPLGGQLAATGGLQPAGQAERGKPQRAQHAGGEGGRREPQGWLCAPGALPAAHGQGRGGAPRQERERWGTRSARPHQREAKPWDLAPRTSAEAQRAVPSSAWILLWGLAWEAFKRAQREPATAASCPSWLGRGRQREGRRREAVQWR